MFSRKSLRFSMNKKMLSLVMGACFEVNFVLFPMIYATNSWYSLMAMSVSSYHQNGGISLLHKSMNSSHAWLHSYSNSLLSHYTLATIFSSLIMLMAHDSILLLYILVSLRYAWEASLIMPTIMFTSSLFWLMMTWNWLSYN